MVRSRAKPRNGSCHPLLCRKMSHPCALVYSDEEWSYIGVWKRKTGKSYKVSNHPGFQVQKMLVSGRVSCLDLGGFVLWILSYHQPFQVPKMEGFLCLIFGCFGGGVSLT